MYIEKKTSNLLANIMKSLEAYCLLLLYLWRVLSFICHNIVLSLQSHCLFDVNLRPKCFEALVLTFVLELSDPYVQNMQCTVQFIKAEHFTPVPIPVVWAYPVVLFFKKNIRVSVKKRVYVCNSCPFYNYVRTPWTENFIRLFSKLTVKKERRYVRTNTNGSNRLSVSF